MVFPVTRGIARTAIIPTRITSCATTVTRRTFRSLALSHPSTSRIAHLLSPALPVAGDAEERGRTHQEHHRRAEHAAEVAEEIDVAEHRPEQKVAHAGAEGPPAI